MRERFHLLVTGGRKFQQGAYVFNTLDQIHQKRPITLLIHGNAMGTDSLARAWAEDRGVAQAIFPANWKGEGKAAGPLRNQRVINSIATIDGCVAFPGERGTADMINRVNVERIPLWNLTKEVMKIA